MSSPRVERFFQRLWYGSPRRGRWLAPLSWAYAVGVAARRRLYAAGWLASGHPGVPVVVVGNITVGGTGKTPVVAWLATQLRAAGFTPGIASRGYGAARIDRPLAVQASSDARQVGDEPLLLVRRTGVPVVVCADRLAAARALVAEGADVVIADDGLQHYALARDLEIAVLDGERGMGNGRLLPAGPLREPRARLDGLPVVLVNGTQGPQAPGWHGFRLRPVAAVRLVDGRQRPLSVFAGCKAWAVAGIGNPGRFLACLHDAGIDAEGVEVPDHGVTDLERLRRAADRPILMTEKDAVKYPFCNNPDAWYVPVELEMSPESAAAVIGRVRAALGRSS